MSYFGIFKLNYLGKKIWIDFPVFNLLEIEFGCQLPSGFSKLENLTYLNLSEAIFIG